uniref:ATP synthase complex subunit 8 n=1 Tax=Kuwayamaea chinensis TaxID=1945532 RepID=A0A1Q1MPU6_9ORTH|nr:ATP synthase F0 subunit 8 [Kuwayamaea chinensis]AQM40112.1 ATP synthase F0 subunit 8 [Kuwayamaea chinensis]
MPQMSPLWWLMMFIIFSITLILFTILNYFMIINLPTSSHESSSLQFKSMNWLW